MNRAGNFFMRKWVWACQNKLFWSNVALTLGTVAFLIVWPAPIVAGAPSDFRIRAWGMVLQLLGAYTVWQDLTGTAREFGATGILRRNWSWLKAGLGYPTVISLSANIAGASSFGSAHLQMRPHIDKGTSLDQRIAALESYVKYIDDDVTGAFSEISQQKRDLYAKIDEKADALQASICATEARLKSAVVGNYSVLLFGAVWLFVGIILSSIASEIAKLVARQYMAILTTL